MIPIVREFLVHPGGVVPVVMVASIRVLRGSGILMMMTLNDAATCELWWKSIPR